MGTNSAIEWTDHTWNPWQGCTKVSPGCKNCYMYRDKARYGKDPKVVVRSAPATFNLPLHGREKGWNQGDRVFVCSWSDFFHPDADEWRREAWTIMRGRMYTFILLTKRPERIAECLPSDWGDGWPNVWLGVSAENQEMLYLRWPYLRDTPAAVRFLSIEPMLGHVSLSEIFGLKPGNQWRECLCDEIDPSDRPCLVCDGRRLLGESSGLHWVIAGGESGPDARPMHPDWVRGVRDQCAAAQVPFFFKQWGEWAEANAAGLPQSIQTTGHGVISRDGGFVFDTDVACPQEGRVFVYRVGKHRAGALLDDREHRELPEAA